MPRSANVKTTSSTWVWMSCIAGALVLGASTWALWGGSVHAKDPNALPDEYSVASLKSDLETPGKMMETMRAAAERGDLTDEQLQKLRRNMRDVWQQTMRERMDEYFSASEDDKQAIMDRQIDEWQKHMDAWEKERAESEKRGEDREESMRKLFGGSESKQERKEQSEARNPDQMAKTMTYFMAVQKRMSERGMKMPWGGPGGGRRGPGRGP